MTFGDIDWELGELTVDEPKMFVLWCIQSRLCTSVASFQHHFRDDDSIRQSLKYLTTRGFLQETSGEYTLTPKGRLALGDLADIASARPTSNQPVSAIDNDGLKIGTMVISTNPLYAGQGIGFIQQLRETQAKVEFRPTVFSSPPYFTESRILKTAEIRTVESPIRHLLKGIYDETWRYDLRTLAAHLLICNIDGQLGDARTDLVPHQISLANKVVTSPRRRYLIADEVGLGKTIETGMIVYALRQRGQAQRVLIITPAGLTMQWQEEMQDKFRLEFAVYREDVDGILAFDRFDYLIASIDTLKLDRPAKDGKLEGHKSLVLGARDWDVIIFDEAHKLSAKTWSPRKTEKTLNYRLAEDLESRCQTLLLITATPHQGDESKFQNLIGLLNENVVYDDFPTANGENKIHFTDLILRNRKSKVTDADGNPIFKGIQVHPVRKKLLATGEKEFYSTLEKYLIEGYGYADQDPGDTHHKAIGFVMTTFQKLAASSTRAIKQALQRRLDNLLSTTKQQDINKEAEYDERYRGEYEVNLANNIVDVFLETEVRMLRNLINLHVPEDSKQTELFNVIDSIRKGNLYQRILIFTEYIATQNLLVELLESRYGKGCTVKIRGGMTLWEKKQSIASFRDIPKVRFLVSTEAGGEGINLQFAHIMINYDLPWNPFRLAQRYGRLYRYGQDKVVQVFNFQNAGTIEDKVREYLETKTKTAARRLSGITGETVEEVEEGLLGLFEEFLDYERIYREGLAKANLKPSQEEIDQGIKKAEKAYETAYTSLFSKDIAPFNPDRFKHEVQSPLTLKDVECFVSDYVKHNGRNFSKSKNNTWEFLLPQSLKDIPRLEKRYNNVTFDRRQAIRHSELEFMALGHPFTNAAIQHCGAVDFKGVATCRTIENVNLRGINGLHCNFTVKLSKSTTESELVYFQMAPIFVQQDGIINEEAAKAALFQQSKEDAQPSRPLDLDLQRLYELARDAVTKKYEDNDVWEEDIFCLNVAMVAFC